MTIQGAGATPALQPAAASDEARLRKVAQQLEGAFVQELFKAMRQTVPQDGLTSGGNGEEIFAGLMDQHLAEQVPTGWKNGLGAALIRQLRGALSSADGAAPSSTVSGPEI